MEVGSWVVCREKNAKKGTEENDNSHVSLNTNKPYANMKIKLCEA